MSDFWKTVVILSFLGTAQAAEREFPVGRAVEKVTCRADPAKSYALYLPSRYSLEKTWPVLFCFDPRGRGTIPIELYREAAERLGFILASSNDYASDTAVEKSWLAVEAVWNDVTSRFAVDSKRLYATGFSGGARMSWNLAEFSPAPLAGIIGVGAGLPKPELEVLHSRLAFYGLVGRVDFNYYEMVDLDARLGESEIPHRLVVFEDRHNWPSAEYAGQALEWMQVEAVRVGAAEKAADFLQRNFESRLSRAKALQSQGDFIAAHQELADLLRQAEGLWSLDEARATLRRLESSKELSRQRKARQSARRDYDSFMAKAQPALQALRSTEISRPGLNQLLADAGIVNLLRRRDDKDLERAWAARRALESILTDCSFYIARDLRRQGDYKRLQVSLQVALKIAPETGWIWWRLAGAFALDEKPEDALDALKTAVERGFNRADLAREDPDLASLREDPKFQEIIDSMGSR